MALRGVRTPDALLRPEPRPHIVKTWVDAYGQGNEEMSHSVFGVTLGDLGLVRRNTKQPYKPWISIVGRM